MSGRGRGQMTVLMVGLMDMCENEIICCLTATNQQEADTF